MAKKNVISRTPESPRIVCRVSEKLQREFRELLVIETGLSQGEILRGLILQALREQKRWLVIKNGDRNGTA